MYRLIIIIISITFLFGCGNENDHIQTGQEKDKQEQGKDEKLSTEHNHAEGESCPDEEIILSHEQEDMAGIVTSPVEKKNINSVLEFPAEIAQNPNGVALITVPVSGRIVKLNFDYGSNVNAGSVLAVIENPQNMGQKFEVKAPVSGTISKKMVNTGQWLEPGEQLGEIINSVNVDGVIKLYPDETGKVRKGQKVEFIYNGNSAASSINFISPILDPATKTIEARAKINNSAGKFSINSFVTARIVTGSKLALVIPRSALISEDEHYIVYTKPGDHYEKRSVSIGLKEKEYVEILDGLNEGDLVVIKGAYQLKNVNYSSGGHGGCEH